MGEFLGPEAQHHSLLGVGRDGYGRRMAAPIGPKPQSCEACGGTSVGRESVQPRIGDGVDPYSLTCEDCGHQKVVS